MTDTIQSAMAEVVESPVAESLPGLADFQQATEVLPFALSSYDYTDHGESLV